MTDPQSAIERFSVLLDDARPPTGGVDRSAIIAEVRPVLPLLEELPLLLRTGGQFEAFEFRECFTVLTLLGRRLALLDLTPTAAVAIADLALASAAAPADPPTPAFDRSARTAVVEGFVMGREERVAHMAEARAAKPVRPLRVDEATFALVVSGVHEPAALGDYVDALGRAMLDADATVGIVDLTQLGEPNRERARAIFTAEEITRMLGGTCVFGGVDPHWRAAAEDARIRLDALNVEPSFTKALATARALSGRAQADANPRWRAFLERLRR